MAYHLIIKQKCDIQISYLKTLNSNHIIVIAPFIFIQILLLLGVQWIFKNIHILVYYSLFIIHIMLYQYIFKSYIN